MSETTNNVVEMATEKKYTLRKLEAKDIAPMASILAKIGLKEFKDCLQNTDVQAIMAGKDDQLHFRRITGLRLAANLRAGNHRRAGTGTGGAGKAAVISI